MDSTSAKRSIRQAMRTAAEKDILNRFVVYGILIIAVFIMVLRKL